MADPWIIALEGGTSTTRARLVRGGAVVACARRSVGVRDTVLGGNQGGRLAQALRETIVELSGTLGRRPDEIVAAGMLSSELGICHVPHIEAPAGVDDLARAVVVRILPAVTDQPIAFVPGVRTPAGSGLSGWAEADLMRGEECETLGAWMLLGRPTAPQVFVWPGSHTKLVATDQQGRIVRSHTTIAGEVAAAIARHTLLASTLPMEWPEDPDHDSLTEGVRLVERDGLGRAAFLVRIAALAGRMQPLERASFWMGAIIADDVLHLRRHTILQSDEPVWVGGRQPQRSLYAAQIRRWRSGPVLALDDDQVDRASALGAATIVLSRRAIPAGPR